MLLLDKFQILYNYLKLQDDDQSDEYIPSILPTSRLHDVLLS